MLLGEEEDIRERTREVERREPETECSRGAVEKKEAGEESRGQKESRNYV